MSRASPWPPITTGSPARGNVVILWFMYIILIFKFNDFAGQNTQTFMTMPMTSVYWLQLRINIVLFRGTLRSSKWPLLTTLAGKKGCPSHVSGVTPLNKTLLRRSLPSTSMLTPSCLRTVGPNQCGSVGVAMEIHRQFAINNIAPSSRTFTNVFARQAQTTWDARRSKKTRGYRAI